MTRRSKPHMWRARLIKELAGCPEGFTDGTRLLTLNGPTPLCLPGFERERAR